MRSLNLDQLRTFLVVAETGSFSEAGRRLNLTQSAVSQQVKELEARLGVRVLDRLGKTAHPTAAGEDLRRHARNLLQQADLVTEAMRTHRDGGWARVRVATSATLAAYVLPSLLLDLRKRYRRLEVTVVAGPVKDVLRRVVNNEVDLAFANNPAPPADPALAIDVVCQSALMAFWPKALGAPPAAVKPQHLIDKAFMFYTPGTLTNELVRRWFEQGQCAPAASMEFDSGLSILPLVQAGTRRVHSAGGGADCGQGARSGRRAPARPADPFAGLRGDAQGQAAERGVARAACRAACAQVRRRQAAHAAEARLGGGPGHV